VCPQALPLWYLRGNQFLAGNPDAGSLSPAELLPPPDPRENEDCLFLDILVSKAVFEKRHRKKGRAPVMVWVYGGGFTFSFKGNDGDPSTIIKASQQTEEKDGVIYIAFNYRVSLPGFLRLLSHTFHSRELLASLEVPTFNQTEVQMLDS
jgi:carboxylesterase type B